LTDHKSHGGGIPMPEFTVKEVRLPELHLPEIKRDDIVRSLSGLRLPEVDLGKARNARIKVPTVTLTGSDVGKLVAAGAAVARMAQPGSKRRGWLRGAFGRRSPGPVARLIQPRKRRSRWPIVIVAVAAVAVAAWALLRRPAVRQRVDDLAQDARERFETMRADEPRLDVQADEPTTTTGFEGMAASDAEGFVNATEDAGAATTDTTNDTPAFEEAGKPH
jgi:hypothetical protein